MIWKNVFVWIMSHKAQILVALVAVAMIIALCRFSKSFPKVWVIGPSERVTVKIR